MFAHNFNLDALVVFVLAGMDVFFNGGVFVIDVFSHAIMDEACSATNVLLTAAVYT